MTVEWEQLFEDQFGDVNNKVPGNKQIIATGIGMKYIKSFISEQIKLAREEAIDECVNALPEEIIVHEYMKTNHNMYTNEACGAWNDYRTRSVISLLNLKKK